MAKYDDMQNLYKVAGVAGSAVGTVSGDVIDAKGYEQAMVVIRTGAITENGELNVSVHHSDAPSSGFAKVEGAEIDLDDTNPNETHKGKLRLNIPGMKRYLRLVSVVGTAAASHGAVLIVGNANYYPVPDADQLAFNLNDPGDPSL